ncbi:hypothetical protein [Arthrobacter globiformis]|uniref:hypothetical protein n=1 Tax=Arthrobacter globiformis TaxID=1665 RepID=UPI0027D7933A|nr:hypothetical protein [Arthrobacter globiformis]
MLPVLRFMFQLNGAAPVCCGRDSELRPAGPDSIAHLYMLQLGWGVLLVLGKHGVQSWS